jgi:hypothetical protein
MYIKTTKHIPATTPEQQIQTALIVRQLNSNRLVLQDRLVPMVRAGTWHAAQTANAEQMDIQALHFANWEMFTKTTRHTPATTPEQLMQAAQTAQQQNSSRPVQPARLVPTESAET